MSKTILFWAIQFSMSKQFSSIQSIDKTLSGACTPGQSGPGSDGNKGVLCIPRSSHITVASPLDCLMSYPGHSLRKSYSTAETQSMYSAANGLFKRETRDDSTKKKEFKTRGRIWNIVGVCFCSFPSSYTPFSFGIFACVPTWFLC